MIYWENTPFGRGFLLEEREILHRCSKQFLPLIQPAGLGGRGAWPRRPESSGACDLHRLGGGAGEVNRLDFYTCAGDLTID
jgi:hypothetical protein